MLGASASRLARRRSSPNVNPLLVAHLQASRKLSTAHEEDEDSEVHSIGHSGTHQKSTDNHETFSGARYGTGKDETSPPTTSTAMPPTSSVDNQNDNGRKQSTTESLGSNTPAKSKSTTNGGSTSGPRRQSRLSIGEGMPTGRMRQRRKAVEISDQRACVLLHSRLKGMKLEDIAVRRRRKPQESSFRRTLLKKRLGVTLSNDSTTETNITNRTEDEQSKDADSATLQSGGTGGPGLSSSSGGAVANESSGVTANIDDAEKTTPAQELTERQLQNLQACLSIASQATVASGAIPSSSGNSHLPLTGTFSVSGNEPLLSPTSVLLSAGPFSAGSFRRARVKFHTGSLRAKRLQALSAEVSQAGAVSGPDTTDPSGYNRHRRLTSLYSSYGPEAAAIVEARNMATQKGLIGIGGVGGVGLSGPGPGGVGSQLPGSTPSGRGPSSLFIFSDDNFIRRHTRFIIEWPYPLSH